MISSNLIVSMNPKIILVLFCSLFCIAYACDDQNCLQCDQPDLCTDCRVGFYVYDSHCKKCPGNVCKCSNCSADGSKCYECDPSQPYCILTNNLCVECSYIFNYCKYCNQKHCVECFDACYLTESNECKPCDFQYGSDCLTCNSTQCLECNDHYFLEQTTCTSC